MILRLLLSLAAALTPVARAQYTTSIVAGGAPANGTNATVVALANVYGMAADSSGNLYFSSFEENRVYKVATNGTISTVAGNGIAGFSGDGGAATSGQLWGPRGIAVDTTGNLYIADTNNYRIRKVTVADGKIATVAGTGLCCTSLGDGGSPLNAQINAFGVAVDGSGNLYLADSGNYRIRKISGNIITTVAGTGFKGFLDSATATNGQIGFVHHLAVDSAGNNIYVADEDSQRIRKIAGGAITTVAGGGSGYSDGVQATTVGLGQADDVAVDNSGNFYLMDISALAIRKVSSSGIITTAATVITPVAIASDASGNLWVANNDHRIRKVGVGSPVAGNGTFMYAGENVTAASAQIFPSGLALDNAANLYIADFQDYRVRKVSNGGIMTTFAGTGTSGFSGDGTAANAQIGNVTDIATDSAGNLYIADHDNFRIREVSGGNIATIAGGVSGYSGDGGPATSAHLRAPQGIAVDSSGTIYFGDQNRIRKISGGIVNFVAGAGPPDGALATNISIQGFSDSITKSGGGIAVDAAGNLYIPDQNQHRVYKVATNGVVTTVAGNGTPGFSGDGGSAKSAQLNSPGGVAVDSAGNVYIADTNNSVVRKVSNGKITTVAGGSPDCAQDTDGYGDGCPAPNGFIQYPSGVAVDSAGNLYIADTNDSRIRKVSAATGIITTVAGTVYGNSIDGIQATAAKLATPVAVAVDAAGNIYIADRQNFRVRKVTVSTGIITTVAGSTYGYSGDGGQATSAQFRDLYGIALDSAGNLYIGDSGNNTVRMVTASNGIVNTVAGGGSACAQATDNVGDGCPPKNATLSFPTGVALDASGNLYISDLSNYRVRKVAGGTINTVAGNGLASYSGDGGSAANAQIGPPAALAVDSSGNLYISDAASNRVRMINTSGTITTVAGGGTQTGEGVAPTSASLAVPGAIALDTAQNLYIVDRFNQRLRKVSGGQINTIATIPGLGIYPNPTGISFSPGIPNLPQTPYPTGLLVDGANRIFVSDPFSNGTVRLLTPTSSASLSISKSHSGNFSQGQSGATYTITVTNGPSAAATSGTVTVTENIPTGLTLTSMSGSGWSCSSSTCTRSDPLSGGASYPPITATVNVAANAPSSVTNSVTVSGGGSPNASFSNPTNIDTRYPLTLIVSPVGAGSINQGTGFYVPGTIFNLTATPNSGFQFTGWTGSVTSTSNPLNFTLNGAATLTANFRSSCSYTLASPTTVSVGASASSGSEGITATCSYSVATGNLPSWLHITSGGTGSGSGAIGYSYDANTGTSARSGSFNVLDGNGFLIGTFTVNQSGAPCTGLTLSPANVSFGALGGNGVGTFTPTCALPASWTASVNASWIHVPASGNSSSFTFTVDDNSGSSTSRTPATITVNTVNPNGTFTIGVTQSGLVCNFGIGTGTTSIASAGFLAAGGTGSITVNVLPGQPAACNFAPWAATTPPVTPPWITLQTVAGFGTGSVTYTVAANPSTTLARTGTVTVAGLTYTINQAPLVTQNYKCSQSPDISATPTLIRVEGETELAGDVIFKTCDFAAAGGVTGDIVVTYNTAITNHRLSTDATGQSIDAILLLNDPVNPALNGTAFQGVVAGPTSIRFPNVPLAGGGGSFAINWRIRNVRVDATQLATLSPSNPTQVIASVSFVAPVEFSVVNPKQVVSNTQPASLVYSKPGSIANTTTVVPLTFTEGWPNAFRNIAAETGYVNSALGSETGAATNATRLMATFTNVPAGVTIYAPLVQTSGPNARLVSADANGVGGFPQPGNFFPSGGISYQQVVLDQSGSGTLTWEVTDSDPNTSQSLIFNVLVNNPGNVNVSGMGISGNLAPQVVAGGPSSSAPVPRFVAAPQTPASLSLLQLAAGTTITSLGFGNDVPSQKSPYRLASLGVHDAVGGTTTATMQLNNSGSKDASGVKVGGSYPPTYQVNSCTPAAMCTTQAHSCSFDLPTMPYGERVLLTCSASNISPSSGGQYHYQANVTSDSGNSDLNTSSFSANIPVPYVAIKTPADTAQVNGQVTVTGLAIPINDVAANHISSVQVTVDDVQVASLQTADFTISDSTCLNFTQYPNACPNVGFRYVWDSSTVSAGSHKICAIATGADSASDTASACVNISMLLPTLAVMTSPPPGTTLTSSTTTFTWAPGGGADGYWLDVGTASGVGDISGGPVGNVTSKQVTGLPRDGSTVYVSLYTHLNGSYSSDGVYNVKSYTYTAMQIASLSSPQPGSTLSNSTVTFSWAAVPGASGYWLDVGTAPFQGNISGGPLTANSKQVTGVPVDGSTVYVTLYTNINGSYSDSGTYLRNSYTYKTGSIASITSPTPGAQLNSTNVTFSWSPIAGATEYWLDVGTSPYVGNISGGSVGANTSRLVTGLPADGSTIYATLYTKINGSYQDSTGAYLRNSYTYTALRVATITSPAQGSTLTSSSVLFSWTAAQGATEYWLDVGTAPFVGNITSGSVGASTSKQVAGLPLDGGTIFATLYTKINGSYQDSSGAYMRNAYTYTALKVATITSPAQGSTLPSSSVLFTWTAVPGATEYWLDVGTSPFVGNITSGSVGASTSKQVTGLPLNGGTVYATLYTKMNGSYQDVTGAYLRNSYTYTSPRVATIAAPTPGTTLTSSSVLFSWAPIPGATEYWLDVGTTPYVGNISGGSVGAGTSRQVNGLPVDGSTVYATLYTKINGSFQDSTGNYLRNLYSYSTMKLAAITSPAPGTLLAAPSVTFSWSSVAGATEYWLDVGTAPYVGNITSGSVGANTSKAVTGLPLNGGAIYATLYTKINGSYQDASGGYLRNAYTYSTVSIASIVSPTPGTTLSGTTVTFSWSAYSGGSTQYWLDVGTAPSQGNIFGGNVGSVTSQQVTGLPHGGTVYVTLYTKINGSFQDGTGAYIRNTYTFAGTP